MPYIRPEDRLQLTPYVIGRSPELSGELNFQITELIKAYIARNGLSYQIINDIRGALVNAGDEFYRRVAVPYENKKRDENGDVYNGLPG